LDSNPTKPFINDHIHSRLHNIDFTSMNERTENILMWIIAPFFIIWEAIVSLATWNLPKEPSMRLPYISILVSLLSLATSILFLII